MRRFLAPAASLSLVLAAGFAVAQDKPADTAPATTDKAADKAPATKTGADKATKDKSKDKAAPKKTESKGDKRADNGLLAVGTTAPAWTLPDADGKTHSLSDYAGKVVVLDFWATWCPPCKKAMPDVQKIHDQFKDKGVVVIGVATWERGADADQVSKPAAYMKEQKFTYNLLVKGDKTAEAYKLNGIPAFYVIGPDGTIVFSEMGYDPSNHGKIVAAIQQALPKS